jgi:hypothetical protein
LREISNPDKHRHLSTIGSPVVYSPPVGSTEAIIAGQPVDMKLGISIQVVFSDGTPVIETLEQLCSQVSETLIDFHSEFQ